MDDDIQESKAFAIKAAVIAAVLIPVLLILLHFTAAVVHVDFTPVKEVEMILASVGILSCVVAWAFKK